MPTRAELFAQHARRVTAAVAFWAAAVLFVTNVSLLSGWLSGPAAAQPVPAEESVGSPEPSPIPTPTEFPSPVVSLTPFTPLDEAAQEPDVELDGGATVTFPAAPTYSDEIVEIDEEDVVLSLHTLAEADGSTYSMGVIEYPESVDLSDPAVNLLSSASGAAGTAGGAVSDQDVLVFQGAPAIEFDIETSSVRVRARNVLHGRRLYSQTVAYTGDDEPAGVDDFFDSFKLGE